MNAVRFIRVLFLSIVLLHFILTAGCSEKNTEIEPSYRTADFSGLNGLSYYYFRTEFNPDEKEKSILKKAAPREIVFRLFDVDTDFEKKNVLPVSPLRISENGKDFLRSLEHTEVSGLVFITNRSLIRTEMKDVPELAENIIKKTAATAKYLNPEMKEIQIDCDWSISTREKYFLLLNILKKRFKEKHINLGATIRLHQIQYREKTGIPPVNRGILMFYNMDDPTEWKTENSIFSLDTAMKYTDRLSEYPLTLDFALPVFSQTVFFSGRTLTGLLPGEPMSGADCFTALLENRFIAKKRCLVKSSLNFSKEVPEGSLLRYERADGEKVLALLQKLNRQKIKINRIYIYEINQALFSDENQITEKNEYEHLIKNEGNHASDSFQNQSSFNKIEIQRRISASGNCAASDSGC